jgi:hypothetical protein
VEQLPTDAKVAGVLAVGGPIKYVVKEDSHVSDQFLMTIVAPKLTEHFEADPSNTIADVLAVPLLWAYHDPSVSHMIAPQVLNRVRAGYNTICGGHPEDYNPVKKVPLHIFRVENQIQIEEITREPENNGE